VLGLRRRPPTALAPKCIAKTTAIDYEVGCTSRIRSRSAALPGSYLKHSSRVSPGWRLVTTVTRLRKARSLMDVPTMRIAVVARAGLLPTSTPRRNRADKHPSVELCRAGTARRLANFQFASESPEEFASYGSLKRADETTHQRKVRMSHSRHLPLAAAGTSRHVVRLPRVRNCIEFVGGLLRWKSVRVLHWLNWSSW
jgi:hypothetical protein